MLFAFLIRKPYWPLKFFVHENTRAWHRHTGCRDPVLSVPAPGSGRHLSHPSFVRCPRRPPSTATSRAGWSLPRVARSHMKTVVVPRVPSRRNLPPRRKRRAQQGAMNPPIQSLPRPRPLPRGHAAHLSQVCACEKVAHGPSRVSPTTNGLQGATMVRRNKEGDRCAQGQCSRTGTIPEYHPLLGVSEREVPHPQLGLQAAVQSVQGRCAALCRSTPFSFPFAGSFLSFSLLTSIFVVTE